MRLRVEKRKPKKLPEVLLMKHRETDKVRTTAGGIRREANVFGVHDAFGSGKVKSEKLPESESQKHRGSGQSSINEVGNLRRSEHVR